MCGVIAAIIKNPSSKDFDSIRNVFIESSVRGLHATGVSILFNDKILTFKESVSVDKFVHLDNLEEMVNDDDVLYLVGHTRYSTSDLEYNQPIADKTLSVVNNGVITQEPQENWGSLYDYHNEDKNDTALLWDSINKGYSPLKYWPDSSMAVCELHRDRKLRFYRNGKRPLYFTCLKNGYIITSTRDIAFRSGLTGTNNIKPNVYMTINDRLETTCEFVEMKINDLQGVNNG